MFQSPQWGSNSKDEHNIKTKHFKRFQSPQWGSNSKATRGCYGYNTNGFSPRNGEVILKGTL